MRILIATTRPPIPLWRGNQLRTAQIAAWLSDEHEVTVLTRHPRGPVHDAAYRMVTYHRTWTESAVGLVAAAVGRGRMPLQAGWYRTPSFLAAVAREAERFDVLVLQLVRLAPPPPGLGDRAVLIDLVDSLSLNFERRAALERPLRRPAFAGEARRLALAEAAAVRRMWGAWIVCERDRAHIAAALAPEDAAKLAVLPLAVACPPVREESPPGAPALVLTGNLGYFPTVEGGLWFLREIWPRLRARRAGLRFVLGGSRPSAALRRAAAEEGAELIESPPDLAAVLRSAAVAVAPLRAGSGQPIKVLEAWAAGVPVVTTSWTAAGTTGVAGRDFLVADDAPGFAAAVERLLDEEPLRRRLAAAARARLCADYDEATLRRRANDLVRSAVRTGGAPNQAPPR